MIPSYWRYMGREGMGMGHWTSEKGVSKSAEYKGKPNVNQHAKDCTWKSWSGSLDKPDCSMTSWDYRGGEGADVSTDKDKLVGELLPANASTFVLGR